MSLSSKYRWVLVSNLLIRNEKNLPAHVPLFTFEEVETVLRDKFAAEEAHYYFQNDEKIMRLRGINDHDEDYLVLLVSIGDKNAPIPAYENFETGEIRNWDKEDDEGLSHASHIIISKNGSPTNEYLMMVEKVPGIHAASIENFLRHIFHDDTVMKEYTEEGEQIPYRCIFEVTGHTNHTIAEALNSGKLEDIEFVSHEIIEEGHDEYGYIKEEVQKATFVIKRGVTTDAAETIFTRARNKFRNGNFDKMFVRIKTNKGQIRRTEIDDSHEDIMSQYFYHSEVIKDFETPLEQTHEEINDEVVNKILAEMQNYINDE